MAALGALFLFGRRSETLQGLGGPGRDERWAMIDLRATALAGAVTIAFVIGAWLYEVARGEDGNEFALIGAVAGLSYVDRRRGAALARVRVLTSGRPDLNRGPRRPERRALPGCATPRRRRV